MRSLRRAPRVCPVIGCPNLVVAPARYCDMHQREQRQRVDAGRPSAAERGYDAEWQKTRKEFLVMHPRCTECGQQATEVDHIVPIADGGTNEWTNLRAMCKRDHSQRTAREGGGFGNKKSIKGIGR